MRSLLGTWRCLLSKTQQRQILVLDLALVSVCVCCYRHAKRTTVLMDDVKLCCRRNKSLLEYIQGQADKIKADKATEAVATDKTKGKSGKKKKTLSIDDD